MYPEAGGSVAAVPWLLSARGVREKAHAVLEAVMRGDSEHFVIDESALPALVERVARVTESNYPDLGAIPYHSRLRHFAAGGVDRLSSFDARTRSLPADERLRARMDLVITSVLLDAGAGPGWRYSEPTGASYARSEGLAVASFDWFMAGGLSSQPSEAPLRADARRLMALTEADVGAAFQARDDNPLVGLGGRTRLLQRLGAVTRARGDWFRPEAPDIARPGALADTLLAQADGEMLPASRVLGAVLDAFGDIWPGRERLGAKPLGDVWTHSRFGRVPFHKLSQWLTYSLCECLELSGVRVTALDELTGLAEYRNGGLFIDLGVIVPRYAEALTQCHAVDSDLVIEWRALTVALLDRVADALRERWHKAPEELPLVKVLEGGTWAAGRAVARELRADATPPICIESDGTVF
ncbi:MAG TPA: DUF1688 family protein [Polyangiaceae bacterium]|nr:DUF1688 family protein [Polyangiaceae bacterium]